MFVGRKILLRRNAYARLHLTLHRLALPLAQLPSLQPRPDPAGVYAGRGLPVDNPLRSWEPLVVSPSVLIEMLPIFLPFQAAQIAWYALTAFFCCGALLLLTGFFPPRYLPWGAATHRVDARLRTAERLPVTIPTYNEEVTTVLILQRVLHLSTEVFRKCRWTVQAMSQNDEGHRDRFPRYPDRRCDETRDLHCLAFIDFGVSKT